MSLLPKSIHRCRRYPTKFNSGRDIPYLKGGTSPPMGETASDRWPFNLFYPTFRKSIIKLFDVDVENFLKLL